MDSKYQKYYDKLKGKDFSSNVSKYKSSLDTVKSKIGNIESTIISSAWNEKGLQIINGSIIPSLANQASSIESGIGCLSTAVSKCATLVSKLESLESACNSYNNCKEEEKESYKSKISSLEKEIDGIISEINAINVDIKDESVTFSGYVQALVEDLHSLETKKKEFIGDVDDLSQYYVDPAYAHKAKDLYGFDNTTGEILQRGSTIHLKPGETRVITIKVPDYTGPIDQVVRTTADGDQSFRSGKYAHAYSDINPDDNIVETVDYRNNKYPQQANLHTNYYDWVITADATGSVSASQTCEYRTTDGQILKGMLTIGVVIS